MRSGFWKPFSFALLALMSEPKDEDPFGFLPYPQYTAERLQMEYLYQCRPFERSPDPYDFIEFVMSQEGGCSDLMQIRRKTW